MVLLVTVLVDAAPAVAEPLARASELPDLASMALLSVVFAGLSVIVRRTGPKTAERARR